MVFYGGDTRTEVLRACELALCSVTALHPSHPSSDIRFPRSYFPKIGIRRRSCKGSLTLYGILAYLIGWNILVTSLKQVTLHARKVEEGRGCQGNTFEITLRVPVRK